MDFISFLSSFDCVLLQETWMEEPFEIAVLRNFLWISYETSLKQQRIKSAITPVLRFPLGYGHQPVHPQDMPVPSLRQASSAPGWYVHFCIDNFLPGFGTQLKPSNIFTA